MSALLHNCQKPSIASPFSVHRTVVSPLYPLLELSITVSLSVLFPELLKLYIKVDPSLRLSDSPSSGSLTNVLINGSLKDTLSGQMAHLVIIGLPFEIPGHLAILIIAPECAGPCNFYSDKAHPKASAWQIQ